MAKKRRQYDHIAIASSLIKTKCACGWSYTCDKLRGKTDEDIMIEVGFEMEKHRRAMEEAEEE